MNFVRSLQSGMRAYSKRAFDSIEKHPVAWTALLSFLIAFISFLPSLIMGQGRLIMAGDFNKQQLTFPAAIQSALKENGGGPWTWNLELGSSLLTAFSFYNLGSPFTWLGLIFPKTWFMYLVGWIYILKYVIAALSAYWYISFFVQKRRYALIGALLYAFCGYQALNLMFYHFHDVVAFFPLMLASLERMIRKKGCIPFILALFLNCLCNYYFYIIEVVFLVVYFLFRCWKMPFKDFKGFCLLTLKCIGCGLLATGMACILFLPSVMYIMGNERAETSDKLWFFKSLKNYLYILKGMLLPGEIMYHSAAFFEKRFMSTSIYLPMVGLSCSLAYFFKKKWTWLNTLLLVLMIASFSPLLSSVFLLGTESNQRWWFGFVLMLALASALVLENPKQYKLKPAICIVTVITAIFYGLSQFVFPNLNWDIEIYDWFQFVSYTLIAMIGLVIFYWLCRKNHYISILCWISLFCFIQTGLTVILYSTGFNRETVIRDYDLGVQLETENPLYRYDSNNNIYNLTGHGSGWSIFSSTIENSARDYSRIFGVTSNTNTYKDPVTGRGQVLGGKYVITSEMRLEAALNEYDSRGIHYYVYEQPAAPMVRYADSYVYRENLMGYDENQRSLPMFSSIVVDPEKMSIEQLEQIRNTVDFRDLNKFDWDSSVDYLAAKSENMAVSDFSRDAFGFSFTTDRTSPSAIITSIPYDAGWTGTMDSSEPVEIINASGMIALIVPGGTHTFSFKYQTPYFKEGCMISAVSWIVFLVLLLFLYRKKSSQKLSAPDHY